MVGFGSLHFRETVPVKRTLWRALDLLILSLLAALLGIRLHSTHRGEPLWIAAFLCEFWFTFIWLLHVNAKWNPVKQITYPERLSKRLEELPGVDMFLTTANPELEPPLMTVNTLMSLLAVDYPVQKLACYVSDDGFSAATYFAVTEALEFAKFWIPFCKKYSVQVRAPLYYFSSDPEVSQYSSPEFLCDWEEMKGKYFELRRRIEDPDIEDGAEPIFSRFAPENHPSVVQILWKNKGDLADNVPHLIYVSREKSPAHPHHFKGGAMNVLTRVSGVITNAAFMVNVDCDMFVNNPAVILHAMCLFLGFDSEKKSGYIQCPQRFKDGLKDDPFGNQLVVLNHFVQRGIDGLQGPFYYGTGCFHRRKVVYGASPDDPPQNPSTAYLEQRFGVSDRLQRSAMDIISGHQSSFLSIEDPPGCIHAAEQVASSSYEHSSSWGNEVGWAYGSMTEDIQTGLRIQAKGWNSVLLDPHPPAFLGNAPIGGPANLVMLKRWTTGLLESLLGPHSPLLAAVKGKLQLRQCLAYLIINVWALASLPELCYSLMSPLCIFGNTSFIPKGQMVMVPATLFFVYNLYTASEYLVCGESLRSWWNNQRMKRISATTSLLFGLLTVGFSESTFEITRKEVDRPGTTMVNAGRFTFDESPIFLPAAALAMINMAALVAGSWTVVLGPIDQSPDEPGNGPGWGELVCAAWAVLIYFPFIGGFFRKAEYGLPWSTTAKAFVLGCVFLLFCKWAH